MGDYTPLMDLLRPEIVNVLGVVYSIVAVVTVSLLISRFWGPSLNAIPTVGSSGWLGSMRAGMNYRTNAAHVIQEGYEKYKSSPFKVADLYRWVVVLTNREHVEELLRASDDDLSFSEAMRDRFQSTYMLPREFTQNEYHFAVIRSQLTRGFGKMCPVIRDEIVIAFDEVLDLDEWKSILVLDAIRTVACRTSNRLFVGLPLCRNPDWIDLNIRFTTDFVKTGNKIGWFPKFMRHLLVACVFTSVHQGIAHGIKLLRPIIEERLNRLHEAGKVVEMPNDLLSWLIEEAKDAPLTVESLSIRMLTTNFSGIHTTSNSFTHALLQLAGNPQYIQPLREEVEAIVEKEGWTKIALAKMRKVDSFLKECQRVAGSHALGLMRKAMRDYTFKDGTFIPKGTTIGVGIRAVHHDDAMYKNACAFEPFRFVEMDKEEESVKNRFISTGIDFLSFGHGKHACPGRFFAANELKSMMAHVVVTYDIKLEDECPHSFYVGAAVAPNPRAHILFRKRVD